MISKKEFEYTVGRNLAKYRKEKKLTQMQVAEMAELSVPFYASVELGNKGLSAYSLYKLSAALGVDINCLLSDDIPDERAKNIEALLSGKNERVKLAAKKLDGLLVVKAKLFCPEIAGLFCRIAGLFCHDSRANLSLKPVCFGIAIS